MILARYTTQAIMYRGVRYALYMTVSKAVKFHAVNCWDIAI
jgi:hypothetical protein